MRCKPVLHLSLLPLLGLPLILAAGCVRAAEKSPAERPLFARTQDVVYGRKYGLALTLDVFKPQQHANGAAVIWVVSGGWFSSHDAISPQSASSPINELARRGYTVFAVVHSSQPKFTIPEILQDMHLAVRYIRFHAADYQIDPDRIGITGASAGGHLSLMQGMVGDNGNTEAKAPIERVSSRVQAVACFYPPTDFLNYGKTGENALGRGILKNFQAPFAFNEPDPHGGNSRAFVPITEEKRILEIGRQISPLTHVTADDPPSLIIHGDKDTLVPMQQAEIIVAKLKEVGVPSQLMVKAGAGHGWANIGQDMPRIVDWFDKFLQKE